MATQRREIRQAEVVADEKPQPRASAWKGLLAIGILVLLLIDGAAYQSWKNRATISQDRYNGFDFAQADGGLWVTRIQVREQPYDIPFYYHPRDLEDIIVRDHDAHRLLTVRNRTVEQVFVSVDPDAGAKVAAIAGVEIARLTGSKYGLLNLPTTGALTRPGNTTADYPVLTCKDATPQTVILQFEQDDAGNAIVRDGDCVILFYQTPDDAVRVADRFAYLILGIMP